MLKPLLMYYTRNQARHEPWGHWICGSWTKLSFAEEAVYPEFFESWKVDQSHFPRETAAGRHLARQGCSLSTKYPLPCRTSSCTTTFQEKRSTNANVQIWYINVKSQYSLISTGFLHRPLFFFSKKTTYPSNSSGDLYQRVATYSVYVDPLLDKLTGLAKPKSQSFRIPSLLMSKFSGFMSRWITSFEWHQCTALMSW